MGWMARVTLQSIADRVGVSRMTVSNAFSRPDQLSAALREKVLAAAAELGYVGPAPPPRALGRAGARRRGRGAARAQRRYPPPAGRGAAPGPPGGGAPPVFLEAIAQEITP